MLYRAFIGAGRGIRKKLAMLGSNHRMTLSNEMEIRNKERTWKAEELAWPNERGSI